MTGCDAIFPGYGFLSENQDFVEICKLHNIKFIGPSSEVMEKMADKSKAKEEMVKLEFLLFQEVKVLYELLMKVKKLHVRLVTQLWQKHLLVVEDVV